MFMSGRTDSSIELALPCDYVKNLRNQKEARARTARAHGFQTETVQSAPARLADAQALMIDFAPLSATEAKTAQTLRRSASLHKTMY